MSIYKLTNEDFDRLNKSLSKALDVEYQYMFVGDQYFEYANIGRGGATKGTTGYKYTDEQKKNISNSLKGKPGSFIGKKHSEKTKKKMSLDRKGTKLSDETKEKMKLDGRRGRKHTEETKQKMRSLALKREELKRQALGN